MSQLIGFGVVGLGIGVAVGLVEVARRQAWLRAGNTVEIGDTALRYQERRLDR